MPIPAQGWANGNTWDAAAVESVISYVASYFDHGRMKSVVVPGAILVPSGEVNVIPPLFSMAGTLTKIYYRINAGTSAQFDEVSPVIVAG